MVKKFKRITAAITLTGATLFVTDAGSSGTLTIDVQKSAAGGGAFSTIFSVNPSLGFGAGAFATDVGVLSTTSLIDGDILRFDVDSFQVSNFEFYVQLEFIAT